MSLKYHFLWFIGVTTLRNENHNSAKNIPQIRTVHLVAPGKVQELASYILFLLELSQVP